MAKARYLTFYFVLCIAGSHVAQARFKFTVYQKMTLNFCPACLLFLSVGLRLHHVWCLCIWAQDWSQRALYILDKHPTSWSISPDVTSMLFCNWDLTYGLIHPRQRSTNELDPQPWISSWEEFMFITKISGLSSKDGGTPEWAKRLRMSSSICGPLCCTLTSPERNSCYWNRGNVIQQDAVQEGPQA